MHVVDGTSPDPMGDYRAIRQELELFSPELAAKPQVGATSLEGFCLGGWLPSREPGLFSPELAAKPQVGGRC